MDYKEKLRLAKDALESGSYDKKTIEYIFPELAESEDERIRKVLIHIVKGACDKYGIKYQGKEISEEKLLAWLEKQGEQKSADKVKPKFHVRDWITNGIDCTFQITSIENGIYYDTNNCGSDIESTDKLYHLWTIQDAKNGDVLAAYENIVLFKEIDGLNIKCHCTYNFMNNPSFYVNTLQNKIAFHPATKEQRDLLFQKMKEAGYEWNAKEKKLKTTVVPTFNIGDTIIKRHNSDINKFGQFTITAITDGKYWYNDRIICDITEQNEWEIYEPVRQKPAWSEEDEKIAKTIINEFEQCSEWCCANGLTKEDCIAWLNRQIHAKWSEEDKKKVNNLYVLLDQMVSFNMLSNKNASEFKDWLKSLRPQPQWKPSDEQMKALEDALGLAKSCGEYYAFDLRILYKQLKKLKGE